MTEVTVMSTGAAPHVPVSRHSMRAESPPPPPLEEEAESEEEELDDDAFSAGLSSIVSRCTTCVQ